MIYLGFILVALAAGFLVYEKTAAMKRGADEYSATLALLVSLKSAVSSKIRTPPEVLSSFLGGELGASIPWLSSLTDEGRVNSFLREGGLLSAETQLSAEDKDALSDFFLELGRNSREEEAERIDRIIALFEKREGEVRESAEKSVKSAWVLFVTAALGIFILII